MNASVRSASSRRPRPSMRAETVAGTSRSRATMPAWSLMVLAFLFVGPVLMFETVFGGYQGAIA